MPTWAHYNTLTAHANDYALDSNHDLDIVNFWGESAEEEKHALYLCKLLPFMPVCDVFKYN
jgi:hypothetical protein